MKGWIKDVPTRMDQKATAGMNKVSMWVEEGDIQQGAVRPKENKVHRANRPPLGSRSK